MSVYKDAVQIESTLTESNLEKHNNLMLNKVLKNKLKDLDLCKDVEEESLGRAFVKQKEPKSKLLQKLIRSQYKISHSTQTYNNMKKHVDDNYKKENMNKFDLNCSRESNHCVQEESHSIKKNHKDVCLAKDTEGKNSFVLWSSSKSILFNIIVAANVYVC